MQAEETQTNTVLNLEHDSPSGTDLNAHSDIATPEKSARPSQARVQAHLANERTYLAWMRTAIALMGFGVVIVRLRALHPPMSATPGNGWRLGLIFALVGLVTVLFSTQHYFSVRRNIDSETYEPSDRWVIIFSLSILLLGAGVIYFVFNMSVSPSNLFVPE